MPTKWNIKPEYSHLTLKEKRAIQAENYVKVVETFEKHNGNLTQNELAELTGTTYGVVSKILTKHFKEKFKNKQK